MIIDCYFKYERVKMAFFLCQIKNGKDFDC